MGEREMTSAELLGEVEELLRLYPSEVKFVDRAEEVDEWCGRVAAALARPALRAERAEFELALAGLAAQSFSMLQASRQRMRRILYQVKFKLRNETEGPVSLAVDAGRVFDYFDELRRVIEGAEADLLFIDPYLNPDFVARYLPHVRDGVKVRLLGQKGIAALASAAGAFAAQHPIAIEVRQASDLHDRWLLVDGTAAYQSGASFKDAAKSRATTLTQLLDAFDPLKATYEANWARSSVVPLS